MATSRLVAKKLRQTATKLSKIVDDGVRETAEFAVDEAIRTGGTMKGYGLLAEITKISNRGGTSTATVAGFPSGFWSIKSYGRAGGYTIRAKGDRPLALGADGAGPAAAWGATQSGPTSGDGRWDGVIEATTERSTQVFVEQVAKGIG